MDRQVDEVKQKTDIVSIVGLFTSLKRSGRNFKGLCPFHSKKTPSFMVSPELQIWHCFGACAEGGDVISFLMKAENITFIEALRELAEKAGITLRNVTFQDKKWDIRKKLFHINKLTAQYYHYLLTKHSVGKQARVYLKSRKLNEKLIETFQIGYAPSSWDSLHNFLSKKGVTSEDMATAGIVIKSDRGSYYDRFRSRVIFPLFDHRGNIVGFSGRLLQENQKMAKYINSPETAVYHKRETLYGIHYAKDAIKKEKKVLIVEGEFDMLTCLEHGIGNVVAIKGSAFTREQLTLLKRFTDRILFALDSDFSGDEAIKRALHDAENLDFELSVVSFDFAKDPDEALKKDPVLFKKLLTKPIPVYDFIIENALSQNPGKDANTKKRVGDAVIPYLVNIQNPILHSHYVKHLASELDLPSSAIEQLIRTYKRKKKFTRKFVVEKKSAHPDRLDVMQKYVLGSVFKAKNGSAARAKLFEVLDLEDFHVPAYKKIAAYLKGIPDGSTTSMEVKHVAAHLPPELRPALQELYLFDASIYESETEDPELPKALLEYKRLSLKRRIKELASRPAKDNSKKLAELSKKLAQVEKTITII